MHIIAKNEKSHFSFEKVVFSILAIICIFWHYKSGVLAFYFISQRFSACIGQKMHIIIKTEKSHFSFEKSDFYLKNDILGFSYSIYLRIYIITRENFRTSAEVYSFHSYNSLWCLIKITINMNTKNTLYSFI